MQPVVILATDVRPGDPAWALTEAQAAQLQSFATRALGVTPQIRLAWLPTQPLGDLGEYQLGRVIDQLAGNASLVFVLPVMFDLTLWQRSMLGEELSAARRRHEQLSIHHDTVELLHPLVVDCFSHQVLAALDRQHLMPQQAGVILVANGQSDPASRADTYRLMRIVWEQTGIQQAEVGFVRHDKPYLPNALKRCLHEPLHWLLQPQCQWDSELTDYAQVMLTDHQRTYPETAAWTLLEPPRDHPAIQSWLEQRLLRLWEEKRARQAGHQRSAKYETSQTPTGIWSGSDWTPAKQASVQPTGGCLARATQADTLAEILERILPRSDRYFVKVTWHGYAQGTYTDPQALDLLLGALPGRAVILEGHTSSRNVGGLDINWEAEAEQHRTWIRQQDQEFLRRTGLAEVIAKHQAQYLNVTETWWNGACASAEEVQSVLGDITLKNPELAQFIPAVLLEQRGTPLISFARFKGATRLSISNLFGLIPHPLRTAWHGAAITDFAAVCCDLAKLYGTLFPLFGLVEAFESAVRWDRKGLYRSRWGNYDLVPTNGLFTMSQGLAGADLLASRLQGQDVARSAFFDVVGQQLEFPASALELPLPTDLQTQLV